MNDLKELKRKAPLIKYIEKHYHKEAPIIKRGGNTAFIECLWHEEDTASLALFSNGSFKCFGCGEHGDIITLVQKLENISFKEACKMIGENVGVKIQFTPPNPYWDSYKLEKAKLVTRYQQNLLNNKAAIQYLINRGLKQEAILKFKLGLTDAEEYKYRTDMGGICNKIVLPIFEDNTEYRCIGMAYHKYLKEDDSPKYLNDINQDGREGQDINLAGVFIKGNTLYGIGQAYAEKALTSYAIIVEGYFDVLSMHQAGIYDCVGLMGTALTQAQAAILAKRIDKVILMLDGDEAGRRAIKKAIPILIQAGIQPYVYLLSDGIDPDDFVKSKHYNTLEIMNTIKENKMDGIEYMIDVTTKQYINFVTKERIQIIKTIMPLLEKLPPVERKVYESNLYQRLDLKV